MTANGRKNRNYRFNQYFVHSPSNLKTGGNSPIQGDDYRDRSNNKLSKNRLSGGAYFDDKLRIILTLGLWIYRVDYK